MENAEIDQLVKNKGVIEDLRVGALEAALRVRGDEISVDAADELRRMRNRIKELEEQNQSAIDDTWACHSKL